MSAVILRFPVERTRKPADQSGSDLVFANLGAFATCMPASERGMAWIAENIGPDAALPLSLDFSWLPDVKGGAIADGLVCDG